MAEVIVRPHALKRAQEMGVSEDAVRECVLDPEVSYPSHGGKYGTDNWVAQRGEIAVAYVMEQGYIVVKSVLPRTQEQYAR